MPIDTTMLGTMPTLDNYLLNERRNEWKYLKEIMFYRDQDHNEMFNSNLANGPSPALQLILLQMCAPTECIYF